MRKECVSHDMLQECDYSFVATATAGHLCGNRTATEKQCFFLSIVRNEVHNTLTPPNPHISSAISTTKGVFHKHPYQQI